MTEERKYTTPTPTQDEQDRHRRGETILQHEPDGSPEETVHNLPHDPMRKGVIGEPARRAQPTPTQAEMDARALGDHEAANKLKAEADEKEAKAAEAHAKEQHAKAEAKAKAEEADPKRASYKTRDAKKE